MFHAPEKKNDKHVRTITCDECNSGSDVFKSVEGKKTLFYLRYV